MNMEEQELHDIITKALNAIYSKSVNELRVDIRELLHNMVERGDISDLDSFLIAANDLLHTIKYKIWFVKSGLSVQDVKVAINSFFIENRNLFYTIPELVFYGDESIEVERKKP